MLSRARTLHTCLATTIILHAAFIISFLYFRPCLLRCVSFMYDERIFT